jgi:hypothetical protein
MIAKLLKTNCISGDGEMQRFLYVASKGSQINQQLTKTQKPAKSLITQIVVDFVP